MDFSPISSTISLLLWMISTYLIGAIPFGYLIGKWHHLDIRKHGSHNIGATNVARVIGKYWGIAAFCLDFLKGYIPAQITAYYWLNNPHSLPIALQYLSLLCLFLPIIGHLYPIFLQFKGGKAVATAAGLLAVLSPFAFITTLTVFIAIFYSFRIISLASLSAALWMPLAFLLSTLMTLAPVLSALHLSNISIIKPFFLIFLLSLSTLSLIIIIRHRSNIKRLLHGAEQPFKKH